MERAPCLVIAEAGVNHNGSLELAHQLVELAAEAGADVVKFQTFKAEQLASRRAPKAAYQVDQTGGGDQLAMLRQLELPLEAFAELANHCRELGIGFLSTPFDLASAEALIALGMRCLKVPSGELTNAPLLRGLAATGLPLIVSTGMATLDEVEQAVEWITAARAAAGHGAPLAEALTLLHCTSNYPTPLAAVNLRAMQTLAQRFGLPVGYSDHTAGISVAPLAVALGARVIEKHFTLDRTLPGPDHQASLEPDELAALVQQVRAAETALGSPEKAPVAAELEVRVAARRSVTLARDLPAGAALAAADLTLQRPGHGIAPVDLEQVLGRQLKAALSAGHTLQWGDLA
ncbi:MAG: N-acetylneuraminate synthase [Cyanobacteria bacterium K_Offshore_0m_m2_072]|nr:N-acetylneuraminate synthase [Cyanobacteria bacterium K_Offshore_0m_m2_072]